MQKKYQTIMLEITIPIILRNRKRSPERCVRNLMELGEKVSSSALNVSKERIYHNLLELCKGDEQQAILEYFYDVFLRSLS